MQKDNDKLTLSCLQSVFRAVSEMVRGVGVNIMFPKVSIGLMSDAGNLAVCTD